AFVCTDREVNVPEHTTEPPARSVPEGLPEPAPVTPFKGHLERAKVSRVLTRMSITKTLWYSPRFRGLIIVGRRVRMAIRRGATISVARGAALVIGIDQNKPDRTLLEVHTGGVLRANGVVSLCRGGKFVVLSSGRLTFAGGNYINEGVVIICEDTSTFGAGSGAAMGAKIFDV